MSRVWKLEAVYSKVASEKKMWDWMVAADFGGETCIDDNGNEQEMEPLDRFIQWLERELWEDMARTVFRETHNTYRMQLIYLIGDIQKPFRESFSNYKSRVEQVFNYLEDFPEPCLRGERPRYDPEADEVKQTPIEPSVVRLAIFESLPAARWRDMYDNCEQTADCRKLSESEFMATMIKIEEQEHAARAASKKSKAPSPSPGKKYKDGNQNSQDGKKRPKRFWCQKCKDLGRSELAYTSHDQAYCKASHEAGTSNNGNNNKSSDSKGFQPSKKEWKKVMNVMDKLFKTALDSDTDTSS